MQNSRVIPFPKSRIIKVRKVERLQIQPRIADQSNEISVAFLIWKYLRNIYPILFLIMFLSSYYTL
jgi:hypothetical protein